MFSEKENAPNNAPSARRHSVHRTAKCARQGDAANLEIPFIMVLASVMTVTDRANSLLPIQELDSSELEKVDWLKQPRAE